MLGVFALPSCKTSSDLSDNSLIKKRRYTSGYALNVKTPKFQKSAEIKTERTDSERAEPKAVAPKSAVTIQTETEEHTLRTASSSPSAIASIPTVTEQPQAGEDPWQTAVNRNPASVETKEAVREFLPVINAPKPVYGTAVAGAPVVQSDGSLLLYIILAILIPPLAVGLLYGIGTEFWISLLLTILFFIPGMIYSLIMVLQH